MSSLDTMPSRENVHFQARLNTGVVLCFDLGIRVRHGIQRKGRQATIQVDFLCLPCNLNNATLVYPNDDLFGCYWRAAFASWLRLGTVGFGNEVSFRVEVRIKLKLMFTLRLGLRHGLMLSRGLRHGLMLSRGLTFGLWVRVGFELSNRLALWDW